MPILEIHFPTDATEKYVENVIDDLGLQNITFVDGILRGESLGEIKVGGLGSGFVDLDGLDVGVVVNHDNVTLTTTIYAKYVSQILVDGVSQKTW